jgi:hypothetical protein
MRNVASISSMSHSVTREWIDRRSMIRSTANSIHELSTRGGLVQPLVTEGAGLVVGIADLDPSGLSPLVIQRALVSVPQVSYTRSDDVQSEKERLLLAPLRHAENSQNVRLPGKTRSDRRTVKTTRMTQNGHRPSHLRCHAADSRTQSIHGWHARIASRSPAFAACKIPRAMISRSTSNWPIF